MADPQEPLKLLAIPTTGTDVGAWGSPVNNDFTAIGGMLGGVASIALSNVNVTLSAPTGSATPGAGPTQSQNALLKFTGALSGNVTITLPLPGFYIVRNNCSNTGLYYVQISGGAGNKVGAPPGKHCHVFTDGTDVDYVNMPDVGTYHDFAGAAVPPWINACTIAPFLVCNGVVYNVSDYPALGTLLLGVFGGNASTTFAVPDERNRIGIPLGGAAARITVAGGNFDGTVLGNSGGLENHTLTTAELAVHGHGVNDPGHTHPTDAVANIGAKVLQGGATAGAGGAAITPASTGISIQNAGSGVAHTILNPCIVHGIRLIKT